MSSKKLERKRTRRCRANGLAMTGQRHGFVVSSCPRKLRASGSLRGFSIMKRLDKGRDRYRRGPGLDDVLPRWPFGLPLECVRGLDAGFARCLIEQHSRHKLISRLSRSRSSKSRMHRSGGLRLHASSTGGKVTSYRCGCKGGLILFPWQNKAQGSMAPARVPAVRFAEADRSDVPYR